MWVCSAIIWEMIFVNGILRRNLACTVTWSSLRCLGNLWACNGTWEQKGLIKRWFAPNKVIFLLFYELYKVIIITLFWPKIPDILWLAFNFAQVNYFSELAGSLCAFTQFSKVRSVWLHMGYGTSFLVKCQNMGERKPT